VHARLEAVSREVASEPRTGLEIAPSVFGEPLTAYTAAWRLSETLCYLTHLELLGRVRREPDGEVDRWRAG
jgi:hypothetical protein